MALTIVEVYALIVRDKVGNWAHAGNHRIGSQRRKDGAIAGYY
jgi:hypothetical protein